MWVSSSMMPRCFFIHGFFNPFLLPFLSSPYNLHNADDTSPQPLDKYDTTESEAACHAKWNNMRDCGFGIGTLCMWARNDNAERYTSRMFDQMHARGYGVS